MLNVNVYTDWSSARSYVQLGLMCVRTERKKNISNKHNRLKNPNWRKADQLATYKHDRGVELGSTEKQLQLSG